MDAGTEPITDDAVLRAVRAQARRVHVQSTAAAALLTAVWLMLS
jgi:hypothetical protein